MNNTSNINPAFLPAHKLAEELRLRRISSIDLVEELLQRISAEDSKLHSFVEIYGLDAREAAAAADKAIRSGNAVGPLHGIPIALKDLIEIEGRIVTGGSASRLQHRASRTATIVNRLIAQGMIILGKTHTVEFAYGGWGTNQHLGTPWNPWDEKIALAPGGSSSGSAVAVASGLVPWAIGTDTGGSVRLPASWCGLTGLKPSSGRISTYGVLPLSPSLDTIGPLTRSVEDAVILYEVLRGPDPFDSRTLLQPSTGDLVSEMKAGIEGKRLALVPSRERDSVCSEVLAAYDKSIDVLVNSGAKIVPFSPPFSFADLAALNGLIMKTEAYSLYADFVDNEALPLDEDVRTRILAGRDVLARDYLAALRKRDAMQEEFHAAMADIDAFLTPTTLTTAVPLATIDQSTTPAHFTRFANFLDLCAIAVPNGISNQGLPTSLQIMGKRFDEASVLRIAWAFQQRTDWHEKQPSMAKFSTKEN